MTSKEAKIVTFEPLDGFQHLRGLFGVLLEDQFNADIILGRFQTIPNHTKPYQIPNQLIRGGQLTQNPQSWFEVK